MLLNVNGKHEGELFAPSTGSLAYLTAKFADLRKRNKNKRPSTLKMLNFPVITRSYVCH